MLEAAAERTQVDALQVHAGTAVGASRGDGGGVRAILCLQGELGGFVMSRHCGRGKCFAGDSSLWRLPQRAAGPHRRIEDNELFQAHRDEASYMR